MSLKVGVSFPTRQAAVHTNTICIVDARPRLNAHANVLLLGKGITDMDRVAEDGFAQMRYIGIENIHRMRDSLQKLSAAFYQPDGDLWSAIGSSKWLHHVRSGKDKFYRETMSGR